MTTDILHEVWLPVAEYEGAYEVSNFGNVRSVDRYVDRLSAQGSPSSRISKGQVLKKYCGKEGYITVCLCKNKKRSTKKIHKLVTKAFKGDRPAGFIINHIDGDKTNNHANNLEYCTMSRNVQHAYDIGLSLGVKGSAHGLSKLTETQVSIIKTRLKAGETQRKIAEDFGISKQAVSSINIGRTWSHIP